MCLLWVCEFQPNTVYYHSAHHADGILQLSKKYRKTRNFQLDRVFSPEYWIIQLTCARAYMFVSVSAATQTCPKIMTEKNPSKFEIFLHAEKDKLEGQRVPFPKVKFQWLFTGEPEGPPANASVPLSGPLRPTGHYKRPVWQINISMQINKGWLAFSLWAAFHSRTTTAVPGSLERLEPAPQT